MRIRRIRLRGYRGVDDCDVELLPAPAEAGVTIVHGPNEVGKSSLVDAVRHALDFADNSKALEIQGLKPAGRDEPTEITLDIETGPYAFTYRKRFNRERLTELVLTAPRADRLSGREAHERVRAMLDETIDVSLWAALRIPQGSEINQAAMGDAHGLARVLASGDGATAIGERETDLYERVTAEFGRYFTRTGQEGKALRDAAARDEEAQERLREVDDALARLEDDIARVEQLERRLPELRGKLREDEQDAEAKAERLAAVERLEGDVERARAALTAADAEATTARERNEARAGLVAQLETARRELAAIEEDPEAQTAGLDTVAARHTESRAALERARSQAREAETLAGLRRRDLELLRDRSDLTELRKRQERVETERERIASAQGDLADVSIADDLLERLREHHLAAERAAAALHAGSPQVRLEAEVDLDVVLDGEPLTVEAGGSVEWTVGERVVADASGLGRLTVEAGAGAPSLVDEHSQAVHALDLALAEAGVADLDAAEEAVRRRREAEAEIAEATRAREDALGEYDGDTLAERIAVLDARVRAHDERPPEPPLPASVEEAARLLEQDEAAALRAREIVDEAATEEEHARQALDALNADLEERKVARAVAERTIADLERRLDGERERCTDEALAAAAGETAGVADEARARLQEAERRLAEADPAAVRDLAEHAYAALAEARTRVKDAEGDLRELAARVELRGGQGLFDQREEAVAAAEQARRASEDLRGRAEAARLLKQTFDTCRDAARRQYVGPLQERIREFGRYLHPESDFDVDLDEDLKITARLLDGVRLPYGALSVGAQEQLSLIGRVAAALLVAEDGGAPLILDDELGYADEARRRAMGAVLGEAGRRLQVVVLTCDPDRFRHVVGARRIALPAPGG